MKTLFIFSTAILIISFTSCNQDVTKINWDDFIDEQLNFAVDQDKAMDEVLPDTLTPRTFENGNLITAGTEWWCSGFYPGSLWYLYEHKGEEDLKEIAHERTMILEEEKYNTGTHDLGFMLYCSFGNGLRLTENEKYKDILLTGAESLMSRYNETIGCIRSWDHGPWEFPVIIDNMMNLEFLFWASETADIEQYYKNSISHTERTMKEHYRDDFSSFHLVDFDTITGEVIGKQTVQGYSDESAWARGQAWGLYGFTTVYRATSDPRYLSHCINVADFLLEHPNMPEDMVPYWDFNAPNIPEANRDASAAAIMASALLELANYVEPDRTERYRKAAKTMLYSLGTNYRAEKGENGNFILKHSVGHLPGDSEVDVPLTYADYYFIEGLMRLKEVVE
ncbi:MAG: glucuronyl hydrolase [bacterium]